MSRELVALLEKRGKMASDKSITLPQTPRDKATANGFRPCARKCGRFVRSRNEDTCTQCRITFVPAPREVSAPAPGEVVRGESTGSVVTPLEGLRALLRASSAVQPFPEDIFLSDWDAELLTA